MWPSLLVAIYLVMPYDGAEVLSTNGVEMAFAPLTVAAVKSYTEHQTQSQAERPGPPPEMQPEIPLFIEHVTPSHWLFHSRLELTSRYFEQFDTTPDGNSLFKGLAALCKADLMLAGTKIRISGHTLSVNVTRPEIWHDDDSFLQRQIIARFEELVKRHDYLAQLQVMLWPPNST